MKKNIAILGSTGSIGTQALQVIENHPDLFRLQIITAGSNAELLIRQAIQFRPGHVVIADEQKYYQVSESLSKYDISVHAGQDAIEHIVENDSIDLVLTAMVGFSGLKPTLSAIRSGKNIALANKETLVVAGNLIKQLSSAYKIKIYPVDSEHSAIFQCIVGEELNPIEKIYLTASGGPFRGRTKEFLKRVTSKEALKHPNWFMGNKITIDSATLMNKGLEVIEAKWLFNLHPDQIDVIVHPQSIIHSIVQFEDGSMKAQMGLPDMKLPIQYALGFPERIKSDFPRFRFTDYPNLTFEAPDLKNFRNLALAYNTLEKGGNSPCILNAANEIAVDAFLTGQIGFLDISDIIEKALDTGYFIEKPDYDDLIQTDMETRKIAAQLVAGYNQ
ncbi:MAG: 1-deoxy-D-xylulose 5-phosphate reductoisomerase [Bacteroides sp. SM23_62_1]|nr:MAG: 1-deoxy-D-xylulose 5-phosphate reductoisomerase [Bacteroides sp. SM23_62_1]